VTIPSVVKVTVPSGPSIVRVSTPGPSGPAGPTGPAGVGAAWQQGAGAPASGVGSNGDFYLNITNGDIYGPKAAGAWGSVIFNIAEGQQGPAGADGRTLLNGTSAPSNATGANGDFFINTGASIIYGPKAAGVWPTGVSLIGPAGPAGAQGPAGAAGTSGKEVQLQTSATHVQWRYIGDSTWTNLLPLSEITGSQGPAGPAGANGQNIELQTSATHIQWRVVGAASWIDLVTLASLTGPAGATGAQGPAGPAGVVTATAPITYDAGTQTLAITAATTSAAGSMSSTDKTKLDGIEAGAQINPGTVTTSAAGLQPASGYGTISYAAQVTIDFAARDKTMHTISLTGALELLASNLANGREVRLRLVCDGTQRTLTFPTDWKFVGTKPANLAASKVAILSLAAFGTTNADVVAAYAVQS
jgi:hypothetical protein